jgi:1-acyl-sn-glycerol-3-phosphate acyltransferase
MGAEHDGQRAPMGGKSARMYSPAWRSGTKVVLPPLIKSLMKRDWSGYQHFPREGGMLVAANHLSYADWPAMSLFVHEAGRYPAFMIKSSAFDVKLIGPFLRILGQLPVRRGEADAANVLKVAEQALADGECVIIYPEGTATRDPDLWPMVAKTGVARLALTTRVPVVPVAQWGAQEILPYGTTKPHPWPRKTVRMLAGPPVDLTDYEGKPLTRDVLRGATNAIMADIASLLAELRGGRPPAAPYHPAVARRAARQAAREAAAQDPTAPNQATLDPAAADQAAQGQPGPGEAAQGQAAQGGATPT